MPYFHTAAETLHAKEGVFFKHLSQNYNRDSEIGQAYIFLSDFSVNEDTITLFHQGFKPF